jgi:hypothetical protein
VIVVSLQRLGEFILVIVNVLVSMNATSSGVVAASVCIASTALFASAPTAEKESTLLLRRSLER